MRKKTDPNSGDLQHAAKEKNYNWSNSVSPIISICYGKSIVCATGNKLSFIVS